MSQPLASDLNNPEFVGAVNPDSLLHCEFYMHNPLDKWASEDASYKEGRTIRKFRYDKPVPFVRIMKPGDQTSIIETEVREDHKRRFPNQWLYFANAEGLLDNPAQQVGTKLEDWPELKDQHEQIRDLQYRRFYTVEQLAGASDGQVQGLGIGGLGFRERARQFLRGKNSDDSAKALAERDEKIAKMAEQMQKMQERMDAMMQPETAKKPGRPRKEAEAA